MGPKVLPSGPESTMRCGRHSYVFLVFYTVDVQQDDEAISAVVLCGENDAFVSNYTRKSSFLSHIADSDTDNEMMGCEIDIPKLLNQSHKIVVAAIRGNVCGSAGLELIMSCDYRVSLSSISVAHGQDLSRTSASQPVAYEGRRRRRKLSPMDRLLSGEALSAAEAKEIGLLDEVIEQSDRELLLSIAEQIAMKNRKRMHPARELRFKKLLYYIPEQFLILRTSQLFNIIRDFPDSHILLDELKAALSITCQSEYVISSLKRQLGDRLLIPGAHTEDVLEMYLRTYRVISVLFPDRPMEVFVKIATPVIHHLQKRPDSVKCIVSSLLDQGDEDDLAPLPVDEEEDQGPKNDTMSLLIGVYGGQDHFLTEYKDLLANRLVSIGSFEIDRELASLDLMKSKFGEAALSQCTVMIRDVTESRRLNNKIRSSKNAFTSLVKSSHFWPAGAEEGCSSDAFGFLPPEMVTAMRNFEQNFTSLKPTQKIEWRKSEGLMTISVEINGRETEFRLAPLYVEVLYLFQSDEVLSLERVAERVRISTDAVKPVIQFWISRGILREIEINKFTSYN